MQRASKIHTHSGKEFLHAVESVALKLTSDCEWTTRITALQRLEGLAIGGVEHQDVLPGVVKLLIGPLGVQLVDRRSAVVKQVCHLLTVLGEELENVFEVAAEVFIPALLKLVVVTVLVIAESAHRCIKTLVLRCRVARQLPKFVETALHDRSPILKTRCAEYSLLLLEQWGQHPEVGRHVDHFESLVKIGVNDAVGEVRSTARRCYAKFAVLWPDKARKLASSVDPATQKLLKEEVSGQLQGTNRPATGSHPGPTLDPTSRPVQPARTALGATSSNIMREKSRLYPYPSSTLKTKLFGGQEERKPPSRLPALATAGGKLQGFNDDDVTGERGPKVGLLPPMRTAGFLLPDTRKPSTSGSELDTLAPVPSAALWNPCRRKRHSVSGALRIPSAAPAHNETFHKLPPVNAPNPNPSPWSTLKPQRLEPLLTGRLGGLAPKMTAGGGGGPKPVPPPSGSENLTRRRAYRRSMGGAMLGGAESSALKHRREVSSLGLVESGHGSESVPAWQGIKSGHQYWLRSGGGGGGSQASSARTGSRESRGQTGK